MNKLIPFSKYSKDTTIMSKASVVMSDRGIPVGFFLGRDTFISLMTVIDEEFDKKVTNDKDSYNNFAGRIIDLIEEKLPINPKFAKDLKQSIKEAKKQGWVSFDEVKQSLDV